MIDHLTVQPNGMDTEDTTHHGTFVAIEGLDGSGTSTVTDRLADELDEVHATTEPAEHFWTGEVARQAINSDDTHPVSDLMFFLGDRAHHIKHTIQPSLDRGKTVISDRYLLSTMAYQQERLDGVVENPLEFIREAMDEWVLYPDITILLTCPPEVAAERRGDVEDDKYEASDFQQAVASNYEDLRREPWVATVDATQPLDEVVTQAKRLVRITR